VGRRGLSAAAGTVTRMAGTRRELHRFELEPEAREWLDSLSDSDYKRVDEVTGLLADGTIVMLTVFHKSRQHGRREIDRAIHAKQKCERDHRGLAEQNTKQAHRTRWVLPSAGADARNTSTRD
jgi:hypothetical protein